MNKKPSMFKYNYVVLKYVFKFCPGFIYYSILNVIASVVKTMSKVLLISEAINVVIKTQNIDDIYKMLNWEASSEEQEKGRIHTNRTRQGIHLCLRPDRV